MAAGTESRHGMWSNRWLFVLAAAGSAVGLGNIWKFPYIAGENGGGAFVLVYLLCVLLIGIPIMMAEVLIGRESRQSPINAMRTMVERSRASGIWVLIGWSGVLAGFLILSYYSVVAGWALYYVYLLAMGTFEGADAAFSTATFASFTGSWWQLLLWHTIFMILTIWIVSRGVSKGLEGAIRIFMPVLFVLLIALLVYAINSDGFAEGFAFMFDFKWDAMGVDGLLAAMGQAFFTLSLGMGAIMAYGAYLPSKASIFSTVTTIAFLDTFVAVAAGLAIFPIVFSNGLPPAAGPSLMFETVPLAFGSMGFGTVFGTVFFVLVSFAAITSAISLTEPALAYLVEEYNAKRWRVAISLGVICWFLGLGSVFSFNLWSDVSILGQPTFFDFAGYVTDKIMLPLGGMFIALFVGFALSKKVIRQQLGIEGGVLGFLWAFVIRLVAPLSVLTVFAFTLLAPIWQSHILPLFQG